MNEEEISRLQPDTTVVPKGLNREQRELWYYSTAVRDELVRRMSPPGALGLPPVLDARRLEWGMPDACFSSEACFERILVFQLPEATANEVVAGTTIIKPPSVVNREVRTAPRGIIVSAGLRALDNLRSNGMELGDIITFVRLSPWHKKVDEIYGTPFYVLPLYAGDIVDNEDLARRLREGELRVTKHRSPDGFPEHCYEWPDGEVLRATVTDNSKEGY